MNTFTEHKLSNTSHRLQPISQNRALRKKKLNSWLNILGTKDIFIHLLSQEKNSNKLDKNLFYTDTMSDIPTNANELTSQTYNSLFVFPGGAVVGSRRQVLNEAHPFGDFDLLLLRELGGGTPHAGRRVVHRRPLLLLLLLMVVVLMVWWSERGVSTSEGTGSGSHPAFWGICCSIFFFCCSNYSWRRDMEWNERLGR